MNRDILNKVLLFAAGAVIGSAVTWKLVKTKYEKIAEEEIESVKEVFSKKDITIQDIANAAVKEGVNIDISMDDSAEQQATIAKAQEIAARAGYINNMNDEKEEKEEEEDMVRPYVITPEEFGEEGYPCISLTYYTDGVLTNDRGKIVTNVDELIGEDSLTHFGEYEDDSVFVRNDDMQIDYEILKDYRAYSEID